MHGGDIYSRQVNMDFSVNVNPLGIPDSVKVAVTESLDNLTTYPEYVAGSLREAIAGANTMGTLTADNILCGNGASELIMAIVQTIRPSSLLLTAPTFSGYERAVRGVMGDDCQIIHHYLKEEDDFTVDETFLQVIKDSKPELVFITNPGNPTGKLIEPEILGAIISTCKKAGSYLVIDECFIELSDYDACDTIRKCLEDNCDNACNAGSDSGAFDDPSAHYLTRLIILRAFTKTYALPGIRLGYAITDAKLAERIGRQLPEWNISIPAMAAGMSALKEDDYVSRAVALIREEREYLIVELSRLGLRVFVSHANYICFKVGANKNFASLGQNLLDRGILIRDCSDYMGLGPGYYRVAVKTHQENVELIKAISHAPY